MPYIFRWRGINRYGKVLVWGRVNCRGRGHDGGNRVAGSAQSGVKTPGFIVLQPSPDVINRCRALEGLDRTRYIRYNGRHFNCTILDLTSKAGRDSNLKVLKLEFSKRR